MSRSRRTKYHSQGTERAYRFKRYAPFIHSSVASKLGHGMSATVYVQTSVDETLSSIEEMLFHETTLAEKSWILNVCMHCAYVCACICIQTAYRLDEEPKYLRPTMV